MVFQNDILAGSSGASGTSTAVHTIDQSIRFNDNDSPYLSKAFSGAGDLQKATMSCWLKMANISTNKGIFTFISDKPLELDSNNNLKVHAFGSNRLITDREFRDPSAWYHIVLSIDSTQAVSTERIRLYVNGQRETSFSTESYPSQNANGSWWSSNYFQIGRTYGTSNYMDGYLAEIVYIDGTALDPSSFGEYNSSNIWIPKDVSGLTFGTNGFHIDGRDASDLGDDESGNGNDFTTSGLASHDQVSDSPTNNFCTLNTLDTAHSPTISNGNLSQTKGSASYASSRGTIAFDVTDSEGFYFEILSVDATGSYVGILPPEPSQHGSSSSTSSSDSYIIGTRGSGGGNTWWTDDGGNITAGNNTSVSKSAGQIISVAVKNGKIYFAIDGTYVLSADPNTESNPNFSSLTGLYQPYINLYNTEDCILNAGQDGTFAGNVTAGGNSDANGIGNFKYSVPSGFKALCTKNLGS